MKHLGDFIKIKLAEKRLDQKEIAEKMGMSPQSMSQALRNRDMRVSKFSEICQIAGIDPTEAFDWYTPNRVNMFSHAFNGSQNNGNHWVINTADGESTIRVLTQMLADKDKIIRLLESELEKRDKNGTQPDEISEEIEEEDLDPDK